MADKMVLKTQQWLNQTYKNKTGYVSVTENGNTGWNTIYALRRALQIELGITATSSNFGPSTTAKFKARFPDGVYQQSSNDEKEDNIYGIIQGACWCKGYSTGASEITKHFYSGTGNAIKKLKSNAGCSDSTSTVTLNVMKALLSMDQFKLVYGGSLKIQEIQRNLNNEYEDYIGLSPCDGFYGRTMNQSMIKVLQAIEGYSVSDATGNFGAGTKSKLPIVPSTGKLSSSTEEKAIKLVRYALCCNGYDVPVTSGSWDSTLEDKIKEFQGDMRIEQVNKCNVDTWMALLLSKGNPDRSCTACDTRFEMTESRLKYLKDNGYKVVGRYLTGGDFKELRYGEPKRILNAGINFFPIFQESGTDLTYFTSSRGKNDAKKAIRAVRKHGIPANNIIYFAVDTDPTDSQISTYILPYFKAISENIGISYKIGIYGTRNVCTQVMDKGYATTCFVSDMSTGFSGNMGFKMPKNWNFDQFNELSNIQTGNTTMDLDKVAYSEKFPAVDKVYDTIINYNLKIKELENLYINYKSSKNEECTIRQLILGITNFLRSFKYRDYKWFAATLTSIDDNFIDYVKSHNMDLYNGLYEYAHTNETALSDVFGGFTDVGHLAATLEGYLSATLVPGFWFGWGGDLASFMKNVKEKYDKKEGTYLEIAKKTIGESGSGFAYPDMCSDADAIQIAKLLENTTSNHPVSEAFSKYFLNDAELRISNYLMDLDNVSLDLSNLKNTILNKMSGVLENAILVPVLGEPFNGAVKDACCEAFAQYIIDNYPVI